MSTTAKAAMVKKSLLVTFIKSSGFYCPAPEKRLFHIRQFTLISWTDSWRIYTNKVWKLFFLETIDFRLKESCPSDRRLNILVGSFSSFWIKKGAN
jgi:hypothetical protein